MKKIIIQIINTIIVFTTINSIGQTLDISKLGESGLIPPSGVYYKDTNNFFNQFEGRYLYQNGNTTLEIELVKKINQPYAMSGASFDVVIGEIKYIENNVLKVNTLSHLNSNVSFSDHVIYGFVLFDNHNKPVCSTCYSNQKRLMASFQDPLNNNVRMDLFFKKVILPSGIETLEMIMFDRTYKLNYETGPIDWGEHSFPVQTYVLTKI